MPRPMMLPRAAAADAADVYAFDALLYLLLTLRCR